MDMAVAEEYIEYYADKYKKLIIKHKFAMPLCKHTDKNKLYNVIETTSNIPAGYYITEECIKHVEKFAQKLHEKFGHQHNHINWLGWITPMSSMSQREAHTSSRRGGGDLLKPFLEMHTVINAYLMFDSAGASQLIAVQCKDIMVGQH